MAYFTTVEGDDIKVLDLLVVPRAAADVTCSTLGKYGISMGDTRRSDNSVKFILKTLAKGSWGARTEKAFFFTNANVDTVARPLRPADYSRLLELERSDDLVASTTLFRSGTLMPLWPLLDGERPFDYDVPSETWRDCAGAWNDATDDALEGRLAAMPAPAVTSVSSWYSQQNSRIGELLGEAWVAKCCAAGVEHPGLASDVSGSSAVPTRLSAAGREDSDVNYGLSRYVNHGSTRYARHNRLFLRSKGLESLRRRGAKVLRPTQEFVDLVTERAAMVVADRVADAFRTRIEMASAALRSLVDELGFEHDAENKWNFAALNARNGSEAAADAARKELKC